MSHASSRIGRALPTTLALLGLAFASGRPASAQTAGTAFTYQGRLTDNGTTVNGPFDLQCALYTAAVGGAQVGPIVTPNDVAVANGLFTVPLDFGAGAFAGSVRFLEIGVRPGASTGAYTTLGARQELKPAPHTVFAQTAPWTGISGLPAGFADGVDNDSGGDITSVAVGTGLTGGGLAGAVSLGLDFPAVALNHNHFGQTWNGSQPSGLTVNDSAVGGSAVRGAATATTGAGAGVLGISDSSAGIGVYGAVSAGTGVTTAVEGLTGSTSGRGVYGLAIATNGNTYGVYGEVASTYEARAVLGVATSAAGFAGGVEGISYAQAGFGMRGAALHSTGIVHGIEAEVTSPQGEAIHAVAEGDGTAVYGRSSGMFGRAVLGEAGGYPNAFAGYFWGNVSVNGTLSKSAGSFKIDHPLDPENRYLYHSFVESPDMMNVYTGNVTTDGDGLATVALPDWFEALNRDFRYQLTVLDDGDSAGFVQVKVVRKIAQNRFAIRTSAPRVEVSWLVTGVRKDAYAEKHRIPVEEWKAPPARGTYIHPADWGQPPERGEDFERQRNHHSRSRPVPPPSE